MAVLTCLLERFPTRELEIHRLCGLDPEFRGACNDYEIAVKALHHWTRVEHDTVREDEYRQLVDEIADEIVERLKPSPASVTEPERRRTGFPVRSILKIRTLTDFQ